jgi:hypothetical protein
VILVVAIIGGLLLVLDVLTRALPPWLVAFYWVAFGIALLRRWETSSGRSGSVGQDGRELSA